MNLLQIQASNPQSSIWVSASAGTGKTKILTDRVLRLLLQGADFNKILCLTFTHAAAGEMKERIIRSLANWSKLNDNELKENIKNIIGRPSSTKELTTARNLYHTYLRSENGIAIQTIHSFCQKILQSFPLESSIAPNFKIIDEIKADSILSQIKRHFINQSEFDLINEYLISNFHELIIDEIFSDVIKHKTKFCKNNHPIENIYDESKKLITAITQDFDDKYILLKKHPLIQEFVGPNPSSDQIKLFFLTAKFTKKVKIVSIKTAAKGTKLHTDLTVLQEQVYQLDQKEKEIQLTNHSRLLTLLGSKILQEYDLYKSKKGLLDYDDLIHKTKLLLTNSEAREWVIYKLDGFINHLLVDEAQDTSKEQWCIIDSLITEFYSGESKEQNLDRTIFVVGDEKQSIFSFQGADVNSFSYMNQQLKYKMLAGGREFADVNLEISYRSAKEILHVVFNVFESLQKLHPQMFYQPIIPLNAFRSTHTGLVELWPLCQTPRQTEQDFWPIATLTQDNSSVKSLLAQQISTYIRQRITAGQSLSSTGRRVTASDFMILFRRRDDLTKEVIKALQQQEIEVSGLDRITLKENLSVQDLLSAARFILNPYDNLNLAALLKSALISLDEQVIYHITTNRDNNAIWDYICIHKNTEPQYLTAFNILNTFLDLYPHTNISNFFHYIVNVMGCREKLNSYNGPDSDDAINELLYIAADYALYGDDSLQSFIFWLDNSESSIKRDISTSDKVRIMTVHAAKGLQAPIVILCDTTSIPNNNDRFIWDENDNLFSTKGARNTPDYYTNIKNLEQQKKYAEYLRLLYVGMTRAEDHLIICGYEGGKSISSNCWYELIKETMTKMTINDQNGIVTYGHDIQHCTNRGNYTVHNSKQEEETFQPRTLTYEHLLQEKFTPQENHTIVTPATIENPMEYGLIFHKILEDALAQKNLSIMLEHPLIGVMNKKSQARINKAIDKIIAIKSFNILLNNKIATEVSIGSLDNNKINLGRIDLIIYLQHEIIIIDYKSDLTPALTSQDIPTHYLAQLQNYKNTISKLYPDKLIRTKILWLENGQLMAT